MSTTLKKDPLFERQQPYTGFLTLLLVYLTLTFIKILFVLQTPSPFIFSDETAYSKLAQSFFESKTFSLWGAPAAYPPPLYPVILSIAYLFGDITVAYPVMKIINAFVSSLIIIPVFLIAKEFLTEKKSIIVAFLSSLLPASFSYTSTIMSENLFYPLFMLSIFFIIKSVIGDNKKWDVLCGLSIGLSVLTKMHGLVLLISLLFALLTKYIYTISENKNTIKIKIRKIFQIFINKWLIFLSFAVVAGPWFLRNGYYFGFSIGGVIGAPTRWLEGAPRCTSPTNIPVIDFIYWAMMHTGYFIFATGIVFFALATLQTWKIIKKKSINGGNYTNAKLATFTVISWISFFVLVLFCTKQKFYGGPYLMGRYIDSILPAFIIMGAVGLDSFVNRDFKSLFYALVVCSFALAFIPINSLIHAFNTPDTYVLLVPQYLYEAGILPFEPNATLVKLSLMLLPFLFLILAKKDALRWKYTAPLLLVFFTAGSAIASGVMYTASNDAQDEMTIGLWLHGHAPGGSVILFDERDADRMKWTKWGTMFWTDNIIKIGNVSAVDADYIVSLHKLDMPVVLDVNTTTEVIRSYDNHYFMYEAK